MVELRLDRRLAGRIDILRILRDAYSDALNHVGQFPSEGGTSPYVWFRTFVGRRLEAVHHDCLGEMLRPAGRELSLFRDALPTMTSAALAAQLLGRQAPPAGAAARVGRILQIQDALNAMDPLDREVLTLRHFEQLSGSEAAQVLGVEELDAARRYVFALRRLREVLASPEVEGTDAVATANEPGQFELLSRLAAEYLQQMRRGDHPTIEEYSARYPELTGEIASIFATAAEIRQVETDLLQCREEAARQVRVIGRRVGDYQILREVGHGGMGVVYEAEQISLGRRVALKILPQHAAREGMALERFRREARAAAKLHHTNIVPVFEVGEEGDAYYYAMQFIQGQGLDQVIAELRRLHEELNPTEKLGGWKGRRDRRRLPPTEADHSATPQPRQVAFSLMTERFERPDKLLKRVLAKASPTIPIPAEPEADRGRITEPGRAGDRRAAADIALAVQSGSTLEKGEVPTLKPTRRHFYRSVAQVGLQISHALAYAHARGLIHRDIKPSNLLLDAAGTVWVTDFGLAKFMEEQGGGLTETGDVVGTLRYVAPERFAGACDLRSDLYSLGLTLYELLLLRPPFEASGRLELMESIQTKVPTAPHRIDGQVPRDLETIIQKAIEREPKQRYQTAEAMAEDLRRYLVGEPILARPVTAGERLVKWARRKPAIAFLVATVIVVSAFGLAGMLWQWRRAVTRELEAEHQRDQARQANQALQSTMEQLRSNAYLANLNLAQRYWDENNPARVVELLESQRPRSPAETDLRGFEWYYLDRLCHSDLLTYSGHKGFVWSVSFSPDGKRAASASEDHSVHIWDAESGRLLVRVPEHTEGVRCVRFSPDGSKIATSGLDEVVRLWDSSTGRLLRAFPDQAGEAKSPGRERSLTIWNVAFHPRGKQLATARGDRTVKIWDVASGRELRTIRDHQDRVYCVAYSPDGSIAASADLGGQILIWESESGRVVQRIKGKASVLSIAFHPTGRRLAAAADTQTVKIWDCSSGLPVQSLTSPNSMSLSVAFSSDGNRVATGNDDRTVRIWDVASGRLLHTIKGHQREVRDLTFRPFAEQLASASADGTVKLWDSTDAQDPKTLKSPKGAIRDLAFSPRGAALATAGRDDTIRLWDPGTGRELHAFGPGQGTNSVAFSADGKLLISHGHGGLVRIWDPEQKKEVRSLVPDSDGKGQPGMIYSVSISPDGKTIAAAGQWPLVHVWDIASGALIGKLVGHDNLAWGVAFHPSGNIIATASLDRTVRLWDVATCRPLGVLRGHQGAVWGVAFHPDGRILASSSEDGTIRFWDLATQRPTLIFKGHSDHVFHPSFSVDGKRMVTSGSDGTVRVWDTESGQETLVLRGHTFQVNCAAIHPDGRLIASGSDDQTIKLWNAHGHSDVPPAMVEP
jgi:WD40 repeat protein/serine/threonine protein kinase/DNA-directed RNA polymerase specialized sigma24 family protein